MGGWANPYQGYTAKTVKLLAQFRHPSTYISYNVYATILSSVRCNLGVLTAFAFSIYKNVPQDQSLDVNKFLFNLHREKEYQNPGSHLSFFN